MSRQNVNDLLAFLAVARERSFTKAAARFGISQSALSHTIRQLEARLGVRLLTRAVAPTEAGERLLERIGPHFDQIEVEVDALNELREKPAGTIRINAPDYAISSVLWPKLKKFLPPSFAAARVKLRSFATARKASRSLTFSRGIFVNPAHKFGGARVERQKQQVAHAGFEASHGSRRSRMFQQHNLNADARRKCSSPLGPCTLSSPVAASLVN